jgi:hypothetical protein
MAQDRLRQIRRGFADDASQDDEPPDLSPLRTLAEAEELADAAARLADSRAGGLGAPKEGTRRPVAGSASSSPQRLI